MVEPESSQPPRTGSAADALERAENALKQLEKGQPSQRGLGLLPRLAVSAVMLLAIGGLVVHTFYEEHHPQVDSTSVALLAVALIAPFVSKLKALELGGAKAEWQQAAESDLLSGTLEVLKSQHEAIRQLFGEVAALAASGPSLASTPVAVPDAASEDSIGPPRPLRRLLWVDDHPELRQNELDILQEMVEVIVASSYQEAEAAIQGEEIQAVVICDLGEPASSDPTASAVRLLHLTQQKSSAERLVVLFYVTESALSTYGPSLERQGALLVTPLFGELIRGLREVQNWALESLARRTAAQHGSSEFLLEQTTGLDVVLRDVGGRRVGIEVASWLQRPQMAAFTDRVSRLVTATDEGKIDKAILLVRPDVIDHRRLAWANERGVEIVGPSDLDDALERIGGTDSSD